MGGSGQETNIASGFATLHPSVDQLLFTLGSGHLSFLTLSTFICPGSHEDHRGRCCHGDGGDGAGHQASQGFRPTEGKTDAQCHT